MTIRYWTEGINFYYGDGELTKNNDFVFDDGLGKHTIFNGYHFKLKHEAFKNYCDKVDEKIKNLQYEVEILREKL